MLSFMQIYGFVCKIGCLFENSFKVLELRLSLGWMLSSMQIYGFVCEIGCLCENFFIEYSDQLELKTWKFKCLKVY